MQAGSAHLWFLHSEDRGKRTCEFQANLALSETLSLKEGDGVTGYILLLVLPSLKCERAL